MKPTIVLYQPKQPGNIGAVARVMANFGIKDLVLINPQCDHLAFEARQRAKHAGKILQKAKVTTQKILSIYPTLVATTAIIGRDTNIIRGSLTPQQLKEELKKTKSKIAILFGNESDGLPQTLLKKADITLTIPTHTTYPTLNLSHSVAIILYELTTTPRNRVTKEMTPATQKEKQLIMNQLTNSIQQMKFSTKTKEETQKKVWKKIFGKAFLTKREAMAVLGFFKKIK